MSQAGDRLEENHQRYRARFSGFPRITRDPDELEAILAAALEIEQSSSSALTSDERTKLADYKSLYQKELDGIREARAQGPAALQAHRLKVWADFVQARYARYFAGQDRRTRDLGILAEMIERAEKLVADMEKLAKKASTTELQEAIRVTKGNLTTYKTEQNRIRQERKKVFGGERATQYANLANAQFNRYRLHFANKSRASRNPALLQHIVDALKEILEGMEHLRDDGFDTEPHRKNIELVKQNLSTYREEVKKIKDTRKSTPLTQRVGELGGAANEVFAIYRENFAGKDRRTRDLGLLGDQIELLLQIAAQMDEIDVAEDDEVNAKNLALVMDMLYLYHREHNLVQQQQKA